MLLFIFGSQDVSKGAVKMCTDSHILTTISSVLSEKAIVDFADSERFRPIQPLYGFLWLWMIAENRDKDRAKVELHKFVANLLVRVRGLQNERRRVVFSSGQKDPLLQRMMMFARFLGLWVSDPLDPAVTLQPIGLGGLQVYLATLVRAREGVCPLLEPGVKQYKCRFDEFVAAVDMVLSEVKFFEREAIKTEIAEMNGKSDNIDLEVSLEMMVDLWLELDARLASRLEALFVAHDANGALLLLSAIIVLSLAVISPSRSYY